MSWSKEYVIADSFESGVNLGQFDDEVRAWSSGNEVAVDSFLIDATKVTIVFVTEPSAGRITELDALVAAHVPFDPEEVATTVDFVTSVVSSEGWLKTLPAKSFETPALTVVSINYANKRTWWYGSDRTTQETVTPDGTGKIYALAVGDEIVNIYEITEGDLQTTYYDPATVKVRVYKDNVELVGKEYGFEAGSTAANTTSSHADSYQVNYTTGVVTFDSDQSGGTIKVSYSVPNHGNFQISPPSGKRWRVHHIELQFGTDHTTWVNPMQFILGVNYAATGGNDYPAKVFTYRGMADILNKANLGTEVPACGELTANLYQIPFDYISGFNLVPKGQVPDATKNTVNYVELKMKYDLPIPGTQLATASFYIFEEDL